MWTGWCACRAACREYTRHPAVLRTLRVRMLDSAAGRWHLTHMKRTNLVLDERLLEEALRLSGERTYSRAVERALTEFVRRVRARRILELAGSGLWEEDLAGMRRDRGVHEPTPRRARRGPC